MKSITFLVHNIYHMGGTSKAITNLANALHKYGHTVEIVSVFKASNTPYFNLNSNIKVSSVIEYNKSFNGLKNIMINRLNKYTPFLKTKILNQFEPGIQQFSSYVERKLIKAIGEIDTDIVVGTRASYNLLVAKYASENTFKIGMEHMNLKSHPDVFQKDIIKGYKHLDLVTTLTNQDKIDYQDKLLNTTKVEVLPNILKEHYHPAKKENIILAAGRYEKEKGFDLLIESISKIKNFVVDHGYEVHIYGEGAERENLLEQINKNGLTDIIKLKPITNQLSKQLSSSKITVVPSRVEGFGLVIIEAMLQNNIVIAFDGSYGPTSLITSQQNGFLSEALNTEDMAEKIQYVIQNEYLEEIVNIKQNAFNFTKQFEEEAVYKKFISIIQ